MAVADVTASPIPTRMAALAASGVPFVHAVVVRAQKPSSAKAGDQAVVLADGSIEGFVGGHCAGGSVRAAALEVLASAGPLLLRILPENDVAFPETPGARVVVNPCLSGGALEIYLQPHLGAPKLFLVGSSPTAEAVAALAPVLGYDLARLEDGAKPDGALAAIVSSHGGDEIGAIRAALDAGVGFVGLVCSHTRGEAMLEELDLPEHELRRVYIHVGLDIGARTPPEIALSILGALVRAVRLEGLVAAMPAEATVSPARVSDPVCGMTVVVGPDAVHARAGDIDHWFCSTGCRDRFLQAQPA